MNKTKIEWIEYTWNPVTGCWGPGGTAEKPKRCPYCYAQRLVYRFTKDQKLGNSDPFMPKFWEDRLSEPGKVKKPSKIFVCSMADLFGDWVPTLWIAAVLAEGPYKNPQHTFQFLTKNPKRLKDFNPWPANCWVGTTITNQSDANGRMIELLKAEAAGRFVSHEPLLESINFRWAKWAPIHPGRNTEYDGIRGLNWAIIGAQTGPGAVKLKPEWVQILIDQYRAAGVPLFLKDNLTWIEKIQEWPHDNDRQNLP